MQTNQELRAMLVEIYNCVSAWDNDDGKMAEANEKTPEDILAGYLKKIEKQTIFNARKEILSDLFILRDAIDRKPFNIFKEDFIDFVAEIDDLRI